MQSVIVICLTDDQLRAFKVTKSLGKYSVQKIAELDDLRCGLKNLVVENPNCKVIGLFPGKSVGFYQFSLPDVEAKKIGSMVSQQINSLLPVSPNNIEFDWRKKGQEDNKQQIVAAASVKQQVSEFADKLFNEHLSSAIIDIEALAAFANFSIGSDNNNYLLLNVLEDDVELLCVEKGQVVNLFMVVVENDNFILAGHELESAAEHVGISLANSSIYITGNNEKSGNFCQYLENAGLQCQMLSKHEIQGIDKYDDISAKAAGAAMLILEDKHSMNLFAKYVKTQPVTNIKSSLVQMPTAIAALIVAVVIAIFSIPAIDISANNRVQNLIGSPADVNSFSHLLIRQATLKRIATERIDIVKLFAKIRQAIPNGSMIDSFNYKKGQEIKISGYIANFDMLYKFQEELGKIKGINNVKLISPRMDTQKKQLKYAIEFDYKNFTRKRK